MNLTEKLLGAMAAVPEGKLRWIMTAGELYTTGKAWAAMTAFSNSLKAEIARRHTDGTAPAPNLDLTGISEEQLLIAGHFAISIAESCQGEVRNLFVALAELLHDEAKTARRLAAARVN
jgi:hypothetical protein